VARTRRCVEPSSSRKDTGGRLIPSAILARRSIFSKYRFVCHAPRPNVRAHREEKKAVPATDSGAEGGAEDGVEYVAIGKEKLRQTRGMIFLCVIGCGDDLLMA